MRAVARAVPTRFEGVPVKHASGMRADGRAEMQFAPLVAICRHLLGALTDQRAVTTLQLLDGGDLATGQMFREVSGDGDVLREEACSGLGCNAARIEHGGAAVFASYDQVTQDLRTDDAVRQAFPCVSRVNENGFVAGISSAEGKVVHR